MTAVCLLAALALESMPWIGDGRPAAGDGAGWYEERPAPVFRTVFESAGGDVEISVACLGYYLLSVDGQTVNEVPMPLWSPFAKTVYADTYRVGTRAGMNVIELVLGNGFYNLPPLKFWGSKCFRDALAHGEPCFKLAVGGIEKLDWEWRESEIVSNSPYLGTVLDFARERETAWRRAAETAARAGKIVERKAPPVAVCGALEGRPSWLEAGKIQIIDFGANATGMPFFEFSSAPGDRIEIVYGERLNADGSVNPLTQTAGQIKRGNGGDGAPALAAQRDLIVAGGDFSGTVPFAWHICRYAEIRGLGKLVARAELKLVSSDLAPVEPGKSFKSADPRLEKLHETCVRTFRSNLVGVQSDCPGREKLGYGGDIVATCEAMMLNFDMGEFYLKTLQDFADEAEDDGWLTETAPYVGICDKGYGGRSGPVAWTVAVPVLIDAIMRHRPELRDRALAYYPVCARYARLLDAKFPGGIIPFCIGDHEALERAADGVNATAHWYLFAKLTARFAGALGLGDDEAEFGAMARKIRESFAAGYVKDGIVDNGTQSAQAIALYLGLVPEGEIAKAEARLLEAIEEKGFAPHTGIFSTRYMLMYLSEHGYADVAGRIVLHEGFPGWMHMLDRGATTLWETWAESDDVYSNCHPMFGSVDEWMLKYGEAANSPGE
ncbi:MAG: family 78 glycoside hydrolase catalytic domain [Kiritimatiellae bacterium]|nr:family 78 glycoside hydrolase catalytic domain [Kiritimatiellia bacterium]